MANKWRGCSNVLWQSNGAWGDPDIIADIDGKTYVFNYWDIEDALWDMFCEDNGYDRAEVENDPSIEDEFDLYCQSSAYDYLEDVVYGGYFDGIEDDEGGNWHTRYESCGSRKKSKKKKIINQGCSSKEGCGSKRRVAKEDSYDDWEGDDGRYVIGKDFNTKDWFIYDNVTDKNVCWCDTEEEAIETVKTLPGYDQKSESYKREGIGVGVKDAGKYYELVDYFDVWGNEEDGWEVNDQAVWAKNGADDIYLSADTTDIELIDYLKGIGYLDDDVKESDLYIDWGDGDFIEIFKADDMMPICCLRLNEYSRK